MLECMVYLTNINCLQYFVLIYFNALCVICISTCIYTQCCIQDLSTCSVFLMSLLFNLCFSPWISPQTHVEITSLSKKYQKGQSGSISCHTPNIKGIRLSHDEDSGKTRKCLLRKMAPFFSGTEYHLLSSESLKACLVDL